MARKNPKWTPEDERIYVQDMVLSLGLDRGLPRYCATNFATLADCIANGIKLGRLNRGYALAISKEMLARRVQGLPPLKERSNQVHPLQPLWDQMNKEAREARRTQEGVRSLGTMTRRDLREMDKRFADEDRAATAMEDAGWTPREEVDTCLDLTGEKCRSLLQASETYGSQVRWVEHPHYWASLEDYPGGNLEDLAPWIVLANRVKFDLEGRWQRDPAYVKELLSSRKPSRKFLEKKLDKILNSGVSKHHWHERETPEWIRRLGGWHATDEKELAAHGLTHGWCFGTDAHSDYCQEIEDQGRQLYFIPTHLGLVAAIFDAEGHLQEAQLPGNKEVNLAAIKRLSEALPSQWTWDEVEQEGLETQHLTKKRRIQGRKSRGKRNRKNPMKRNPHTSEWLVVTPHSSEWPLRRTAQVLVDWGYATGFSVRRTKEGKKQALAVTFDNVPEVRVSVPEPEPGALYAIGSANRYESAVPTIQSYLRQYGKVKGYATMSRTNPVTARAMPTCPDCETFELGKWRTGVCDECKRQESGTWCDNCQGTGSPICCRCEGTGIDPEALRAKKNPSKIGLKAMKGWDGDVYDPRDEAVRAVARGTEGKWGAAMGKYRREHSNAEIIQRSWERYQDPDEVLRDRQAYEVMLGKTRGSGPYRVTQEPTREGMRFFVWPLRIGQRVPKGYTTMRAAERRLAETYYDEAPKAALPSRKYTKKELSDWLPPDAAFKGRLGFPSRAKVTEIKKARSTRSAPKKAETGLAASYTRYRSDWKKSPRLVARFKKGKYPPRS